MIRQARTGDTVLAKSRETTGRTQTLPWWLGGEGVKTTENKIHKFSLGEITRVEGVDRVKGDGQLGMDHTFLSKLGRKHHHD
jgi:hypothetical protein